MIGGDRPTVPSCGPYRRRAVSRAVLLSARSASLAERPVRTACRGARPPRTTGWRSLLRHHWMPAFLSIGCDGSGGMDHGQRLRPRQVIAPVFSRSACRSCPMRFVPRLGRLSVALLALAPSLAFPLWHRPSRPRRTSPARPWGRDSSGFSGSDTCMQLSGSVEMTAARGHRAQQCAQPGFHQHAHRRPSGTPAPAGDPWKQMR